MIDYCYLCVEPDQRVLRYLDDWPTDHFNVYVLTDNPDYHLDDGYQNLTHLSTAGDHATSQHFTHSYDHHFIKRVLGGRVSAAWDWAMWWFVQKIRPTTMVWFAEEDVYHGPDDLIALANTTKGADLVIKGAGQNSDWHHWPSVKENKLLSRAIGNKGVLRRTQLFHSLHCVVGIAPKLFELVGMVAHKCKRLFHLEYLLPTLASYHQLVMIHPPAFKTIVWKADWHYDDVQKGSFYHPVKSIDQQMEWRKAHQRGILPRILPANDHIPTSFDLKRNRPLGTIWLVAGLRRSGNHMIIGWLLSGIKSPAYFFNDVYFSRPHDGKIHKYNQTEYQSLHGTLQNKLLKHATFYQQGKGKDLVISLEDRSIERLDELYNAVKPWSNRTIKVLVMRDLLNCLASRLAHIRKSIQNKQKPQMRADAETIRYWKSYHRYGVQSPDTLTIRYNDMVDCFDQYQEDPKDRTIMRWGGGDSKYLEQLTHQLSIDLRTTTITTSNYGGGSSFGDNHIHGKDRYLKRWEKYRTHPLIRLVLKDRQLMGQLKKDYNIMI